MGNCKDCLHYRPWSEVKLKSMGHCDHYAELYKSDQPGDRLYGVFPNDPPTVGADFGCIHHEPIEKGESDGC